MAKYPKGMPGRQHFTSKKRKKAKREKDPLKLIMERGLHMEERWQQSREVDEDGQVTEKRERVLQMAPKGVVLAPIQTMMLASFLQQQQQTIEMLLADDDDDDEDQDQGADNEAT